jgi:hypothetical protein
MSTEKNKATFRKIIEEGFNKGNLNVADECLTHRNRETQWNLKFLGGLLR